MPCGRGGGPSGQPSAVKQGERQCCLSQGEGEGEGEGERGAREEEEGGGGEEGQGQKEDAYKGRCPK